MMESRAISSSREQNVQRGALEIAIILDSYNVSAWIADVIDGLVRADFLDIRAVVVLGNPTQGERGKFQNWLFRQYAAWDARSKRSGYQPTKLVDISARFQDLFATGTARNSSIDALQSQSLDALIWLASLEPEKKLRKLARYGAWLYRQREPAYFWEIYDANPVTRSRLEVWRDGLEAPLIVDEAFSATVQGWSWRQNQDVPYRRSSAFMSRSLRRLLDRRDSGLAPLASPTDAAEQQGEVAHVPTNWEMGRFLLRNAARTLSRRIRFAGKESHWFVAYRTNRQKFVANTEELDLRGFRTIPAPEGHFYADPFVIKWQGVNYLFVEDYLFAEGRGCISVMQIGDNGAIGEPARILDLPYHLSYPFVFEHAGELFMIPETLGAGRIDLYRASDVTKRWEFVKTLKADVTAVDTTLWVKDGQFYFFTNIAERGATVNDDLFLFYADELTGEWKPHPSNPIVTDVRCSRAAGKLFRRKGKLIRPAQDCSVRYGYACQLNEVELLTPSEYRERRLERIEPNWASGLIGTHTINNNEDFEVIDGQIYGQRYPKPKSG